MLTNPPSPNSIHLIFNMSKPPGTSGGKRNDALYRVSSATLIYLALQWGLVAEYIVTSHRYIYQRGETSISDVPVTLLQVHRKWRLVKERRKLGSGSASTQAKHWTINGVGDRQH